MLMSFMTGMAAFAVSFVEDHFSALAIVSISIALAIAFTIAQYRKNLDFPLSLDICNYCLAVIIVGAIFWHFLTKYVHDHETLEQVRPIKHRKVQKIQIAENTIAGLKTT